MWGGLSFSNVLIDNPLYFKSDWGNDFCVESTQVS